MLSCRCRGSRWRIALTRFPAVPALSAYAVLPPNARNIVPLFEEEQDVSDVSSSTDAATSVAQSGPRVGAYAWYVFWLMCGINFFNYVDRYILVAVSPA